MEIVRDHFGAHAVERGQVVDRLEERPIRREVLEVSDVMTRDDDVATRDGHGRLQLCTDRQHRALRGERERHGLGCVPARPAEQLQPAASRAFDGVVAADVYLAVVCEEAVDHRPQPRCGVAVVVRDRLVAAVAARHHERTADTCQQQVVQRRVGQEHAEVT